MFTFFQGRVKGVKEKEVSRITASSLLLLITFISPCQAETEVSGTIIFVQENDAFYNTDRHYTNGLKLTWIPGREASLPEWAVKLSRYIPWFPEPSKIQHGYSFGQSMFTPSNISVANPPEDERPYAGWLYSSIILGVEFDKQLDLLVLTLGIVGPLSLAEQSQNLIHKIIGNVKEPQGWDTQLGNEPGLVAAYQRYWRGLAAITISDFKLDLTPHIGAAIGNVYTYANTGFTLRFGRHLPNDYGPPRIEPGMPTSGDFTPASDVYGYLFSGIDVRAVAHNIFLDGNTFRDSRSVDKYPFVRDLQIGVVLNWQDIRFSYSFVSRTKEFRGQDENDNFGVFNVAFKF